MILVQRAFVILSLAVAAMLSGCAGVEPDEDEAEEETPLDEEDPGVPECDAVTGTCNAPALTCTEGARKCVGASKYRCLGGVWTFAKTCAAGCNAAQGTCNSVPPVPQYIYQCGFGCSAGLYQVEPLCLSTCGGCSPYGRNATRCSSVPPATATYCGNGCPAGYTSGGPLCTSVCGGCSPYGRNATRCVRN